MADYTNLLCEDPASNTRSGAFPLRGTQTASLAVSLVEPEGVDYTRAGKRFFLGRNAGATGIAPVQAQMTTAAQWAITNTSTTLSMVFDTIGMILDSGVAGATGNTLYLCHFSTPAQSGFATGMSVVAANGGSATSSAAVKSGVTITAPAAPTWFPVAGTNGVASTTGILGYSNVNYEVRGRIIVQPGKSLGFAVCGAAGTSPLYGPVAEWYEILATNS